jgi:hypothetical protein
MISQILGRSPECVVLLHPGMGSALRLYAWVPHLARTIASCVPTFAAMVNRSPVWISRSRMSGLRAISSNSSIA